MRKIFSLFAAVLVALVANAEVINITNETPDALRLALNGASDGDEIVMAAGTYVESNGDYIAFDNKAVTVKAAEGAEVIIQPQVPITVSNGGHAIFENVKIDASRLTELADWYEHLLYVTDENPNGCTFRGCELYGFNLNKSMFYCNATNKVAAMRFENCYFHDLMKSIIFVENTAGKPMLNVKNCTFANISTNTESYWAGIIDVRAAEATLTVDHCTFYNVIPMNTDYSCVSKITLAKGKVSNCIFMLPTAQDGIRAMRGVTATNCITFNYLKDSGTGIHSSVTQNNCVQVDPLFVNAAEGNFTLGEGSPALTMNQGEPIGDPRWVSTIEPEMKTIYCKMAHNWWAKDGAAIGIYTWDEGGTPKTAWPGDRMALVEGETNVWSFALDINKYKMCIFTRMNPVDEGGQDWGAKTVDLTIPMDENDMFVIDAPEIWGDPGCAGIWTKYGAGPELDAPDAAPADPVYPAYQVKAVYSAKYNADCNFGEWGSQTQYAQEDYGKKYITAGGGYFGLEFDDLNCSNMEALHLDAWIAADATIHIVPIIRGSGEIGVTVPLQGQKWNSIDIPLSAFAGVANWNAVYQIKIDQAPNLTFWLNNVYFYTTVAPVVDLKDGYYLIGLNGWTEYDLTAADKFTQNPENTKEFFLDGVTLKAGQEFKVVAVANNALGAWYPGEAGNYQVDLGHAGENKSIYFRPDYSGAEDWYERCIYVPGIDLGPIVKASFATYGWGEDKESYVTWDEATQTITVNLVKGKDAQWQAQVWYQGPIAQAGKLYDISVTFNSTKAIGGVTLKYENNMEMIYDPNIALEANTPLVYERKDIEGKDNGDGIMVFDFGFALENTVVTLSNISIVEKDPEGIINTNAAVKTVKMIENGQVVIIKNGVRYNVLGTVIR